MTDLMSRTPVGPHPTKPTKYTFSSVSLFTYKVHILFSFAIYLQVHILFSFAIYLEVHILFTVTIYLQVHILFSVTIYLQVHILFTVTIYRLSVGVLLLII